MTAFSFDYFPVSPSTVKPTSVHRCDCYTSTCLPFAARYSSNQAQNTPQQSLLSYPQQLPGIDPTGVFPEGIKRRKTETDAAMQSPSPATNPVLCTIIC